MRPALAALGGAFLTALIFRWMPDWTAWWENSVIPSTAVSLIAGIVVTLMTNPDAITHEDALRLLEREREDMATG